MLLKNYFALKTEEERYNYYSVNYDSLCKNFRELLVSLEALYKLPKVRGMLIAEGKDKKYIILVAQLALVTNALIDGTVLDYNGNPAYGIGWKIEKKTINQILENETYITDNDDGKPLSAGYPKEMESPKAPVTVAKPARPEKPARPVEPEAVAKPGDMPTPCESPVKPAASKAVSLAYESMTDSEKDKLSKLFESGGLSFRNESANDFKIEILSRVERKIISEVVEVSFYSEDGESCLYSAKIEKGDFVVYEGELPVKPTDAMGEYIFSGWQTSAGEAVSLAEINEDVNLYPIFETVPFSYNVTWESRDVSVTERYVSGNAPVCPFIPTVDDEGDFFYEFVGWDKPIEIVSCNVTYKAVFEKRSILELPGGVAASIVDDGRFLMCNAYSSTKGFLDIANIVDRASEKRGLIFETAYGSVKFSYSEVISLKELSAKYLGIDIMSRGATGDVYTVSVYDENMLLCQGGVTAEVRFVSSVTDFTNAFLYTDTEDGEKHVSFKGEGRTVSFRITLNSTYTLDMEYSVTVTGSELVSVTADKLKARPGEHIRITLDLPIGVVISKILITTDSGEVMLLPDDSFYMPMDDVTIAVVARYKTCTVVFKSDGVTISSQKLNYGEKITYPASPKKESDGVYSYKFVGWSENIEFIAGDLELHAVYEKELLPEKIRPGGIVLSRTVWHLLITATVGMSVALTIAVVAVILLVKWRRRRRNMENAQKSED